MKFTCAASALLLASHSAAYDIIHSSSVNCREKSTTKSKVVKVYQLGDDVDIVCQVEGQKVSSTGSNVWDKTQDGCYVLDYYIYTGFSGISKPLCSDTSKDASSGAEKPSSSSQDGEDGSSESGGLDHIDSQSDSSSLDSASDSETGSSDSESSDSGSDDSGSDNSDTSGVSALAKRPSVLAAAGAAAGLVAALF